MDDAARKGSNRRNRPPCSGTPAAAQGAPLEAALTRLLEAAVQLRDASSEDDAEYSERDRGFWDAFRDAAHLFRRLRPDAGCAPAPAASPEALRE